MEYQVRESIAGDENDIYYLYWFVATDEEELYIDGYGT